MKLVDQWRRIETELPDAWSSARLALTVADDANRDRAVSMLAPAGPGRAGSTIRFATARRGEGVGPEAVRRLLRRLDQERIAGTLELLQAAEPAAAPAVERRTLAAAWTAALATLPVDWNDLYVQLDLTSTDHLDTAAFSLAPANPLRVRDALAFRIRCARRTGYGVSPEMLHRCFERLDADRIPGGVRILRALSDTDHVQTQGPVWYVEGRAV